MTAASRAIRLATGGNTTLGQPRTREGAFGYMEPEPDTPKFAQCETCTLWLTDRVRCFLFSDKEKVLGSDSCDHYAQGNPITGAAKPLGVLTPRQAGFVHGRTRCENCISVNPDKDTCLLYRLLNRTRTPQGHLIFSLKEEIKPRGCCNAFMGE